MAQGIVGCTPIPTYPVMGNPGYIYIYIVGIYRLYIICYNPQEIVENTINTMGTLLGVHPIVPWIAQWQLANDHMTTWNGTKESLKHIFWYKKENVNPTSVVDFLFFSWNPLKRWEQENIQKNISNKPVVWKVDATLILSSYMLQLPTGLQGCYPHPPMFTVPSWLNFFDQQQRLFTASLWALPSASHFFSGSRGKNTGVKGLQQMTIQSPQS